MAKKKLVPLSQRQWEPTEAERGFEERALKKGYAIKGIREYQARTDYLMERGGTEMEISVLSVYRISDMDSIFANFENMFDMFVKLNELRAKAQA